MKISCAMVGVAVLVAHGAARADDAAPPADDVASKLAGLQAQIDELKASADSAPPPEAPAEPPFRVFGFIDMGFEKLWSSFTLPANTNSTFVLGNIDLYFDFHPAESWSALVETRLTNAPHGTAPDTSNGPGWDSLQWGGVVLERAYIQWQKRDSLGIRVGEFLTPYGIWNVDHGTPTLITLAPPQFVSTEMWPRHQIGVEAFGREPHLGGTRWDLEYHAYVSNGRASGDLDLSEKKTVGGRVVLSTTDPHRLAFGFSAFDGDYVEAPTQHDITTDLPTEPGGVAYTERGIAADVSADLGAWRLRAEAASRVRDFEADKREPGYEKGVWAADGTQFDMYGLAAYRVPGTPVEPYLYGEAYRWPTPIGDLLLRGSVGVNYYITPSIQLRAQYVHQSWRNCADIGQSLGYRNDLLTVKLVMGL